MVTLVQTIIAAALTLGVISGFDLGLTDSGRQQVAAYLHPLKAPSTKPGVLLVGVSASDQLSVIPTAESRGYQVLMVPNSDAGIGELSNPGNEIRVVVINSSTANARYLARFVKSTCPNAKIITVDHTHSSAHLARQILSALV